MRFRKVLSAGVLFVLVGCNPQDSPASATSSGPSPPQSDATLAPTSSTMSARQEPSDADVAGLTPLQQSDAKKTIEAFLEAYNSRHDLDAATFFAPELRAQCGGTEGMARALGMFRSRDRLRYELEVIEVRSPAPSTEFLTVSTSLVTLTDSGDVISENWPATIRLVVDDVSSHGWVLADAFPPGVTETCAASGG